MTIETMVSVFINTTALAALAAVGSFAYVFLIQCGGGAPRPATRP